MGSFTNPISAISPSAHRAKAILSFLLVYAEETESPLALWRLPGSDVNHLILADRYRELSSGDLLEDLQPGFLMAPFDKNKNRLFLPADRFFSFTGDGLKPAAGPLENASHEWLREHWKFPPLQRPIRKHVSPLPPFHEKEKEAYLEIVRRAVQEIEKNNFEKIVPSRTRSVVLPDSFDIIHSFEKLCSNYPEALISYVYIPEVARWLGASPEVLVSVADRRIFKTVALAGTLPYEPGLELKSVAWTQKEIEEQALVERYVISCFKSIRLREYEEHGPKTVIAGNLLHLKSEFKVDMEATNFPQLGSVMLQLLHPTSAVCGMPLDSSLKFLDQHEGYDRKFYAGYLGPVNVNNNIELFVNLRCMELAGNHALLYAGAGVTMDSIPEKEWAETEMKLNTLLKVIL
jgi:isochorismate synthase